MGDLLQFTSEQEFSGLLIDMVGGDNSNAKLLICFSPEMKSLAQALLLPQLSTVTVTLAVTTTHNYCSETFYPEANLQTVCFSEKTNSTQYHSQTKLNSLAK